MATDPAAYGFGALEAPAGALEALEGSTDAEVEVASDGGGVPPPHAVNRNVSSAEQATASAIIFMGHLRWLAARGSRRGRLWLDEGQHLPYPCRDDLSPRTTKRVCTLAVNNSASTG